MSAYWTAVNGGSLGDAIKAGAIAGATAYVLQSGGVPLEGKMVVGGLASVAQGGKFLPGALAAGFSSAAGGIVGPVIGDAGPSGML